MAIYIGDRLVANISGLEEPAKFLAMDSETGELVMDSETGELLVVEA